MPDPHKFVTVIPPVNDTIQPEAFTCCEWCGFVVCYGTMSLDRISGLQIQAAKGCKCSNLGSPTSDSPMSSEPLKDYSEVRNVHLVVRLVGHRIEERYITNLGLKAREKFDEFCKMCGASEQDLIDININLGEKPYWSKSTERDGKPHQAAQWCRVSMHTKVPPAPPTDEYTGR